MQNFPKWREELWIIAFNIFGTQNCKFQNKLSSGGYAGRKRSIGKDHSWQFGWFPLLYTSTNCTFNLKTLNSMGWNIFHLCTYYFDLTLKYNLVANLILVYAVYIIVAFKSHKSGKEGFNHYIPERNGGQLVNELVLQHKKMGQNTGSFGTIAIPSMWSGGSFGEASTPLFANWLFGLPP